MSRLVRLGESELVQSLKTVRQDFYTLKSTVQPMGSASVVPERVESASSSDFTVVATYNVINIWEVTFTPVTSIANSGFVWQAMFIGSGASGSGTQVTYTEFRGVSGNVWTYRFCVIGTTPSQTLTYNVKVVLYAMSQGAISVSSIM